MSDQQAHLKQAGHNEVFFSGVDPDLFSDWAVTVLFYTALHYIDAYLAKEGHLNPGSHPARNGLIRHYPATRRVAREYFRLRDYSVNARYYGARFSRSDVVGLQKSDLQAIRTQMLAQLA